MDVDLGGHIDDYRRKRDMLAEGLRDHYEFTTPGRYYLRVQSENQTVVPFGGTYLLHLSLPGGQGQVILNSDFED